MTSFSENNNSFRVDVKVPRPCRPDNGPVVDDEYWDRGATAMVLADADEGFVCDAAASVVDRNTKTSGSSIASDHTTKTSTSSIQSAESKTSTSSIQSAESGVFCEPGARPKSPKATRCETQRLHKMRRQTGGYIRPNESGGAAAAPASAAVALPTIIPEEDDAVMTNESVIGTAELVEQSSILPPPLVSVDTVSTPELLNQFPPMGNICSTPIAFGASMESLDRKQSFLDRSADWFQKNLRSPKRKRRPSDLARNPTIDDPCLTPIESGKRLSSIDNFLPFSSRPLKKEFSIRSECGFRRNGPMSRQNSAGSTCSTRSRAGGIFDYGGGSQLSLNSYGQMSYDKTSAPDHDALEIHDVSNNDFTGNSSSLQAPSSSQPYPGSFHTIDNRMVTKHKRRSDPLKNLRVRCVRKFNDNPKEGIQLLVQHDVFAADEPEKIAKFLREEGRLSKKKVGEYIGARDDINQEVLRCFISGQETENIILVEALRQFLQSFRLPGEAQQIDRIMDSFAKHYFLHIPMIFEETDTCFVVCFGIIMLNTVLHNPSVKVKTTEEDFIRQYRGMNSGKDLDSDFLKGIYRSIKEQPFVIPDESYDDLLLTFFSMEMEGYLYKQGGSWKTWKRRYFAVTNRCLYYFQDNVDSKPKGIVPLENVIVECIPDKDGRSFCFEISRADGDGWVKGCKTDPNGTVVQASHKSYVFSAETENLRDKWVQTITESIRPNDPDIEQFHRTIEAKKSALRLKNKQQDKHDIP